MYRFVLLNRLTLLALSCAFFAAPAVALQLGPMEVLTDFGEPFEARIDLDGNRLNPRDLSLQFFHSRNAEQQIALRSVLQLARLRYSIEREGEQIYIRLYTREPLQEVRIGFYLTVSHRRGNETSRKYLNILPGTLIAGTDGAFRDLRRSQRVLAGRDGQGWQLGIASPGPNLVISSSDYYAVWNMAQQVKSGYGISAFQAMMAIFDINQHAFGQDNTGSKNINYLWSEEELRMPTRNEMSSYDLPSSIVEVARHNYYADQGPIDTLALGQVVTLEPVAAAEIALPEEDVAVVEPYQPEEIVADVPAPAPEAEAEVAVAEPEAALPVDPVLGDARAGEEDDRDLSLLLYILIAGLVVVVVALLLLLRRKSVNAQAAD